MPYRRRPNKLGPPVAFAAKDGDLSAVLPPGCAESCHAYSLSPQGRVATPVVVSEAADDGGGLLFNPNGRTAA